MLDPAHCVLGLQLGVPGALHFSVLEADPLGWPHPHFVLVMIVVHMTESVSHHDKSLRQILLYEIAQTVPLIVTLSR